MTGIEIKSLKISGQHRHAIYHEKYSHDLLIGGTNILEIEPHDSVVKITHMSLNNSLFSIKRVHIDQIVASETIHKENIECLVMT